MYKKGLVFLILMLCTSSVLFTGCGCVKTVVKTPTDLNVSTQEAERTNAAGTAATTASASAVKSE